MLGKVGNHWCIQQQTCHGLIRGQLAYDIVSQETRNRNATHRTLEGKEIENIAAVVERRVISVHRVDGKINVALTDRPSGYPRYLNKKKKFNSVFPNVYTAFRL
jgi:hypothetical protein